MRVRGNQGVIAHAARKPGLKAPAPIMAAKHFPRSVRHGLQLMVVRRLLLAAWLLGVVAALAAGAVSEDTRVLRPSSRHCAGRDRSCAC